MFSIIEGYVKGSLLACSTFESIVLVKYIPYIRQKKSITNIRVQCRQLIKQTQICKKQTQTHTLFWLKTDLSEQKTTLIKKN